MTAASNEVAAVIQADRDMVQAFHRLLLNKLMEAIKDEKAGARLGEDEGDAGDLVQAFARHRIAHSDPRPVAEGLWKHFERMQDMMRQYVEPTTYFASFPADNTKHAREFEEPGPHDSSTNSENKRRRMDRAFISDMIHMMDGPEQRALATHSAAPMAAADVEAEAISLIVDLCGAGASQSATNVRVVEDHLRQFARQIAAHPSTQEGGK